MGLLPLLVALVNLQDDIYLVKKLNQTKNMELLTGCCSDKKKENNQGTGNRQYSETVFEEEKQTKKAGVEVIIRIALRAVTDRKVIQEPISLLDVGAGLSTVNKVTKTVVREDRLSMFISARSKETPDSMVVTTPGGMKLFELTSVPTTINVNPRPKEPEE